MGRQWPTQCVLAPAVPYLYTVGTTSGILQSHDHLLTVTIAVQLGSYNQEPLDNVVKCNPIY